MKTLNFYISNLEGNEDNFTENFKRLSCVGETTDKTDDELVNIIKNDKINITVDLVGNFAGGRAIVFAKKPAPIQISYLVMLQQPV